ncbi:MAG: glycosyltransferase family 39 protein [Thermoanaerobaculia bacterium]
MSRLGSRAVRTLVVLAVALLFRVTASDALLPGFNEDEAYAARNAARFASGAEPLEPLRLYPHGISQALLGGFQPGYYYAWPAAVLRLAGWSRPAWRLASILPSVAMVLLLYPLGAGLLGERRAFLAALFLAASRWHASDGRWGWHAVFAAALGLAGLLLVEAAARRGSAWPAAAGGVLVGLGVPCYAAAAPPALASGLLLLLPRPRLRPLAAWAGGLALGLLPLLAMFRSQPEALLARGRAASLLSDAGSPSQVPLFLAGNVIHYAGLFHVSGDPLPWHTLEKAPALDLASGLAFLAGLLLALRRPLRPPRTFALVLLLAPLSAGLLSQVTDAPNQYRVGLAAPATALLAASGALLASRLLSRRARAARLLPAGLLLASAGLNAHFLFVRWPSSPGAFDGYGGLYTTLAADVENLHAAGIPVAVSPGAVPDRLRLDVAMARSLADAAAAGTRGRLPYAWTWEAQGDAALVAPGSDPRGTPRLDRWGRVLYRVVAPSGAP